MAYRTSNSYLVAFKAFCAWSLHEKRIVANPLAGEKGLNANQDPQLQRRALSEKDFRLLIQTTMKSSRVHRKMNGQDRALPYYFVTYPVLYWSVI